MRHPDGASEKNKREKTDAPGREEETRHGDGREVSDDRVMELGGGVENETRIIIKEVELEQKGGKEKLKEKKGY